MRKFKKLTMVALCAVLAMGLSGIAGCSGGQVAATVNGENIMEDEVTEYIAMMRSSYGLTDDTAWAQYLAYSGSTAESIRSQVIQSLASEKVVVQAAKDAGYSVSEEDIDNAINSMKSRYGSDEDWNSMLEKAGIDEDFLRKSYESYALEQQVEDNLVQAPTPTDEQIQQAIDSSIQSYDGAKRSSHILFSSSDEATAQQVLQQLKDGADFATMAQQYSTDTGSAANGGDVGWDNASSFVTEYQSALDGLSKGEMTQDLVQSQYGYHIILCTDEFHYNSGTTYTKDNLPDSIYEAIVSSLSDSLKSQAYSSYVQQLVSSADIQINDMPSGLPYDVDTSSVSSTGSASSGSTSSDGSSTGGSDASASPSSAATTSTESDSSSSGQ